MNEEQRATEQAKISLLVVALIQEAGLELVNLEFKGKNQKMIEVLIDHPGGGITLEECVRINKKIISSFEPNNIVDYDLVVASPGLDYHLKNAKDFRRVLNNCVTVLLTEKVDGKGQYKGLVKEVKEDVVFIAAKKKEVWIPFNKIMKAVLVIEWFDQ